MPFCEFHQQVHHSSKERKQNNSFSDPQNFFFLSPTPCSSLSHGLPPSYMPWAVLQEWNDSGMLEKSGSHGKKRANGCVTSLWKPSPEVGRQFCCCKTTDATRVCSRQTSGFMWETARPASLVCWCCWCCWLGSSWLQAWKLSPCSLSLTFLFLLSVLVSAFTFICLAISCK